MRAIFSTFGCLFTLLVQGQFSVINPYVFSLASLNVSLISYWKMDEVCPTGCSRADATATGNTLTDNNIVSTAAGKIINAGQFNNVLTAFLSRADNASLSTGDIDWTLCCWVNINTAAAPRVIASKWGNAGAREYRLYYSTAMTNFVLTTSVAGTVGVEVAASNFGAPSLSTWYFVACGSDAVNDNIWISVNNGTANTLANVGGTFDSTAPFYMGQQADAASLPFDGQIDEMGFWKKKLSAAELTGLYNGGAGRTCCPF